ncbi:hypothetical protein [Methylobacterium oryzisoli]|uniref:hypothetical protein n=1 Tax=Methylobacterium oryzisoli TaxID=3385502 RepID=UPI003892AF4E
MSTQNPFPYSGPTAYTPADTAPAAGRASAEATLTRIPGVQGMGEGRDAIGDPAWVAYVSDRSVAAQLPARLEGRAVVPEVTGEIDILPA